MCSVCVQGTCESQKTLSDPLQLELWMVMNYHMNAGDRTWVLCKNKYA